MQIFTTALIATVSAQTDFDFGNFDLSQFGLGPGAFGVPAAPAAPAAAEFNPDANDERYFFTATTTTTTTDSTTSTVTVKHEGIQCWKCDAMTYEMCATEGRFQVCPLGDKDCCFIEVREKKQKLMQLCTGCKAKRACEDNKYENFVGIPSTYQCRPDYRHQKLGKFAGTQSVCRQCFRTCDPDMGVFGLRTCFGQIEVEGLVSANWDQLGHSMVFLQKFSDSAVHSHFPWSPRASMPDTTALGIPTWAVMDIQKDITLVTAIGSFTSPNTRNVWFPKSGGNAHGKATTYGTPNNVREVADEMTFWAIQGASKEWWMSDLKEIQDDLAAKTVSGDLFVVSDFVHVHTPVGPTAAPGAAYGKK